MVTSRVEAIAAARLAGRPQRLDQVFRCWSRSAASRPALVGNGALNAYGITECAPGIPGGGPDHSPVADGTVDALMAHASRQLTAYKRPSEIIVLDTLPTSSTGKILKHRLKA